MKSKIRTHLDYRSFFVITLCFSAILHYWLLTHGSWTIQIRLYFAAMDNYMADFFNLLRYIADRNPIYIVEGGDVERAYLPICYLILYPFSKVLNYGSMGLVECWSNHVAMFSSVIFTLISVAFIMWSLFQFCERIGISKLYCAPLVISTPFLYTIERGNLIILAAASAIWFLANYDSEIKWKRYLSCFMLALAAALKVYPVIFGILYLRKRMWKEIVISAAIAIILAFAPFFFFEGGISRLGQLLINVKVSTSVYSYPGRFVERYGLNYIFFQCLFNTYGEAYMPIAFQVAAIVRNIEFYIAIITVVIAIFVPKDDYSVMLLILGLLYLPANSGLYCGLYLFPAVLMFIRGEAPFAGKIRTLQWLYFFHLLTPLQYYFDKRITISNGNMNNIFTFLVMVYAIVVSIIEIIKKYRVNRGIVA